MAARKTTPSRPRHPQGGLHWSSRTNLGDARARRGIARAGGVFELHAPGRSLASRRLQIRGLAIRAKVVDSYSELSAGRVRFTDRPTESTYSSVDDIGDLLAIESFVLVSPPTFDGVDAVVASLIRVADAAFQAGRLREASYVQGLLDEAIEGAQSKLARRALLRINDQAIATMAGMMGRRLRGIFQG